MTLQVLRDWFATFNARYFGNALPVPRFVISHAKRSLGQFCCRKERQSLFSSRWKTSGYTIKMSDFYQLTEHEQQSVLLHEMIHFYITFTQTRDTSAHGRVFRQWMTRLNADGWGITITSRNHQTAADEGHAKRQYLLLALTTTAGKHIVSVVNPAYRRYLEQLIERHPVICSHQWIVSSDQKYAAWPQVRSLRGHAINAAEYAQLCGNDSFHG